MFSRSLIFLLMDNKEKILFYWEVLNWDIALCSLGALPYLISHCIFIPLNCLISKFIWDYNFSSKISSNSQNCI